jgi:MFS family permease
MGLSAVASPLLALRSGYDASAIGVYIALSAVAQLSSRAFMGAMMRRIPDKYFVMLAGVSMGASCAAFSVWTDWWAFALSQVLQGLARGIFWTGTQTHAVRTSSNSVSAIAKVNLASGIGQVTGPFVCGPIVAHWSATAAMLLATVCGLLVVVPSSLMLVLPPMRPKKGASGTTAVWRRPGVALASWGGATAGAWRAMMNSYVPIVLEAARHSSNVIGAVVAVANAASIASGYFAGRIHATRLQGWLVGSIVVTGIGLGLFGLLSSGVLLCSVALAASGIGAGLLQTVGPAMATEAVEPEERGEAIASAGTFRAAALFAAPLSVAALVTVLSAPVAVAVAGAMLAVPSLLQPKRSK